MNKSRTNTHSMLGILNSFENRLQKLDSTIEPVYNETEMLRRRQESILCRLLCCRDRHGGDFMVVGFTAIHAISAFNG